MMNKRKWIVVGVCTLFTAVLVAACTERDAPVAYVQPPQAPVMNTVPQAPVTVVQTAPATNDGFFTGMLMGHLMSGGGGGVSRNTTVINRSVTNVTRVAPRTVYSPRPSYSYSRPSYSSSRASSFGSFRSRR